MRRQPAVVAFVAWTFFVWTTRLANIWRDGDLDTGEKWGRTGLALSFTLLGLAVVVALWRQHARATWFATGGLAAWTVGVWVARDLQIVLDADHDIGFKAVHTVLAVVSIVLAACAWREVRRGGRRAGVVNPPRAVAADRAVPAEPRG